MLAIADWPHGSAYAAEGSNSSVPGVNRRMRKSPRRHRSASSLAASFDERYVAKQPFLVTNRPSKCEPSEIPFARIIPNEITGFILHLKGSRDKKGVDNPQSLVYLFELLHTNRGRHSSPHFATLPEPSNRVSISLEARAVDRVDARKEARVPGFEGSIPNPQDLSEAGDDLGSGVDRGGGWGGRGLRRGRLGHGGPGRFAVAAGHEDRDHGGHDQQCDYGCRHPSGAGGAVAGRRRSWMVIELHGVPLGEGRMVEGSARRVQPAMMILWTNGPLIKGGRETAYARVPEERSLKAALRAALATCLYGWASATACRTVAAWGLSTRHRLPTMAACSSAGPRSLSIWTTALGPSWAATAAQVSTSMCAAISGRTASCFSRPRSTSHRVA